jgi:hypothetical protein
LYIDGDVKFVNAVEFGAEKDGSRTMRSCGETVPTLVELDAERTILRSYVVCSPWNELSTDASMSNAEKSSKSSMSEDACELLKSDWEDAEVDIP